MFHFSSRLRLGETRGRAWALLPLAIALALAVGAQAEVSREYQIKAAFLYNFTKFVEWPPECFADERAPIVIGVCEPNPFGEELTTIVRERFVNGRHVVVRSVSSAAEARGANLLFVPSGSPHRALAETLKRAGVLVVGEVLPATHSEGAIRFVRDGDKVRFEIDQDEAEREGVKLSAQLLKLAARVDRRR